MLFKAFRARPATARVPLLIVVTMVAVVVLLLDRAFLMSPTLTAPPPPAAAPAEVDAPAVVADAPAPPAARAPERDDATKQRYVRAKKPLAQCAKKGGIAKTFLIVFQSRSGSTAICSELKAHTQTYFEELELLDRKSHLTRENVTGAIAEARAFFDRGIARGLVPGFKIRPHDIIPEPEKWQALMEEYDTRVVWQYRKNIVKSCLGTYQYEYLNDSTPVSGIKKKELKADRCSMGVGCKFRIENMRFFHQLLKDRLLYENQAMRGVDILDGKRDCVMELPYEDYLYYPEESIRDLQRFLGLRHEQTSSDRVKATNDSLCDVVENFDELCGHFYGCVAWQPFFEDLVNDCRCTNFRHSPSTFCETQGKK